MDETDKYPTRVEINRGPKVGKSIIGKKYLNHFYAMKAIDTFKTERMIDGQISTVVHMLETEGYDVDSALEAVINDEY
jgi:hypothetical protein